ncbi:hypothetical protein NQZ79_g5833 [Umbelopsis isabellina]|nr:hypothetical protein NQZ79_g5833 [Umbelopsis isabellina]
MSISEHGLKALLDKAGLEFPEDILCRSEYELANSLKCSEERIQNLKTEAASSVYPWKKKYKCASDLFELTDKPEHIGLGDVTLDRVLGGGILTRSITEVVGQSSSGKTQLLLQLLLRVQLPTTVGGLNGEALYIYSEGKLPTNRLQQLITSYTNNYPDLVDADKTWNSIYTIQLQTTDAQHTILAYQLPVMLEKHPNIRLVVIDSIAALYRGEHHDLDDSGRLSIAAEVCDLGIRLKRLADQHNVAVVVANQVADDFALSNDQAQSLDELKKKHWKWTSAPMYSSITDGCELDIGAFSESLSKRPALGLTWANSVNCRIRLARSSLAEEKTRRVLFLEFASDTERKGAYFEINDHGIRSI